jgi:flavin reductase (DIM6/NTAB) family NADH-FMN oxidoreductase RutF
MERQSIAVDRFHVRAHSLWEDQWFLLSSGSFDQQDFNSMTVAWGSLGVMWHKPFAQVVVRPVRYTFGFMERFDSFTLCAFPASARKALQVMGTRSGRDGGKIAASGLTPVRSTVVAAPSYAEAELVLECRKIYSQDMDPQHFLDPEIERNYPQHDYHRIYFGEVLAIQGTAAYRARGIRTDEQPDP